jgi:heme exporter protein D
MSHFADYVALAVAIHGVALVIVNMTPTPKDNQALDSYTRLLVKLYRVIEVAAGIISPKVKR